MLNIFLGGFYFISIVFIPHLEPQFCANVSLLLDSLFSSDFPTLSILFSFLILISFPFNLMWPASSFFSRNFYVHPVTGIHFSCFLYELHSVLYLLWTFLSTSMKLLVCVLQRTIRITMSSRLVALVSKPIVPPLPHSLFSSRWHFLWR